MAFDFLLLSETYRQMMERNPELLLRRATIVKSLLPNYKSGQNRQELVIRDVQAELPETTASQVVHGAALYRALYKWLNAPPDQYQIFRAKVFETEKTAEKIVEALEIDELNSWASVERAKTASRKTNGHAVNGNGEADISPGVLPTPAPINPAIALRAIADQVEAERTERDAEIRIFREQLNETHLGRLAAESHAIKLERELESPRSENLMAIARMYPQYPGLLVIAEELAGKTEARAKYRVKIEAALPQEFTFRGQSGAIRYSELFVETLMGLSEQDHEHVLEALECFASKSFGHDFFKTVSLAGQSELSPAGQVYASHWNRNLKIVWTRHDDGTFELLALRRIGASALVASM